MTEPLGDAATAAPRGRSDDALLLRRLLRRPAGVTGLALTASLVAIGVLGPWVVPGDPLAMAYPTFTHPSRQFLMGTDAVGREVLPRVVHGVATSMTIVLAVTLLSALLGILLGTLSGYLGGVVDSLIMRVVDMLQSVPRFLTAIVVVTLLGSSYQKLILLLGLTSWTFLARIVRSEVLSVRRREFVEAGRALGASDFWILTRHVLPHSLPAVMVVLPLFASRVVLIEAGLAFLGLGDPNRVSLGFLITEAQPYLQYYWWLSVFPGLALVAMVLGFTLMGDAFNDELDRGGSLRAPRERRRLRKPAGSDAALPQ